MNYILNIHTTEEKAIVNLSNGDQLLGTLINAEQKEHASFLHTAIRKILAQNKVDIGVLKAVGVSAGPGSYTGIRVGLATAKGLCFALKIPMMMFNSLELMAYSAIENQATTDDNSLFCPMIDARRMEVFTAMYDKNVTEINAPVALVLNESSLNEMAKDKSCYYFGSGAEKFMKSGESSLANFHYILSDVSSESLSKFSWDKFQKKEFENIVNARPLYVKEFYSTAKIG